jgi:hypothetical protein
VIYGEEEFNSVLLRVIRNDYRHPLYQKAVDLEKEMSVHVYGEKPVDLLRRVRPGEDEEITEYRLANYEATTKAPTGKAIKIISKIFNPNLSSIVFPEGENASKLKEYTMSYYPVYNSLTVYNKDVTLKKMIADANGLMAVKPQRAPQNDAERIKPIVVIYGSENVWNWDLDHYLVNVEIDKSKDGIFYTFEYFDTEKYLKFVASSPKEDTLELEILEEVSTNFKDKNGEAEIPAWRLRGNSIALDNGDVMFESFFADAKPNWNLAVIHESDVLGAYVKHMHPQRVIIGEECSNNKIIDGINYKCNHGVLRGVDAKKPGSPPINLGTCDLCHGLGRVASSPYEDHVVLKSKLDEFEGSKMDAVGYVSVPVDATKMLQDRAKQMVREGMWAINMDVEDEVGEVQSGVAKTIDRSAQSDTIYDIAVVMYDIHFTNQFYFINKYMNSVQDTSANRDTDVNLPQVNKPTRFNVESIAELVANFKVGKDSGLDRNYLQAKMKELLGRDLETNPDMKRYYISIIDLDPLFGLTTDDIDSQLMKGTIKKSDVAIHYNLKPFVDRALSEDKKFLDKKKQEQLVVLEAYADELINSEAPKVTVPLLPLENESA